MYVCIKCKGIRCDTSQHCKEYKAWPNDQMEAYLKQCKSLCSKSKPKAEPVTTAAVIPSFESSLTIGSNLDSSSQVMKAKDKLSDTISTFFESLSSKIESAVRTNFYSFFSSLSCT